MTAGNSFIHAVSFLAIKEDLIHADQSICLHSSTALRDQSLFIVDAPQSHSDTPHAVRLLWTSDKPQVKIST